VGELLLNLWREHHVGESIVLGNNQQAATHTSRPSHSTEGAMA
jgi:hypothetical protein